MLQLDTLLTLLSEPLALIMEALLHKKSHYLVDLMTQDVDMAPIRSHYRGGKAWLGYPQSETIPEAKAVVKKVAMISPKPTTQALVRSLIKTPHHITAIELNSANNIMGGGFALDIFFDENFLQRLGIHLRGNVAP